MTANGCAALCAQAARNDIRNTLTRHFQLNGDHERAEERANALLDHYDHQQAERLRNVLTSGEGDQWNWWDAATIPASCADLIDPEALR